MTEVDEIDVRNVNEFAWPIRVYYEDTDLGGVVYHANYLKFMERARTEWLRVYGFEQDELKAKFDVIFVVHHVELDFLQPARFNDQLRVTVRLEQAGRVSLDVVQEVINENNNTLLCRGSIRIVSLSASAFKPCPLPEAILQQLKN